VETCQGTDVLLDIYTREMCNFRYCRFAFKCKCAAAALMKSITHTSPSLESDSLESDWVPVCVRLCLLRVPVSAARYSQPGSSHAYGRSPLCVRLCNSRLPGTVGN